MNESRDVNNERATLNGYIKSDKKSNTSKKKAEKGINNEREKNRIHDSIWSTATRLAS